MGLIVSIVISALISGFVIWIVGRLGLGLEVAGFGAAFIAAIVIAVVTGVLVWLLGLFGLSIGGPGLLGAIMGLIVAAIILMISDKFVPGMKVNGFGGALVAAIAIGIVNWLVVWVLGLFGLA